jgi:hypothetical protein
MYENKKRGSTSLNKSTHLTKKVNNNKRGISNKGNRINLFNSKIHSRHFKHNNSNSNQQWYD